MTKVSESLPTGDIPNPAGFIHGFFFSSSRWNGWDFLVLAICLASFVCSLIESMVNVDNMHWGWAYLGALDIKRGAVPHVETFTFYGYLHTWILSLALRLFGDRLISVGVMTGIFYSLSLLLSYWIFLKILPKPLALLSVFLIFLIHPYIIYPSANYFMYCFELLALVFFLNDSRNRFNGFLAGVFIGMAVLTRYSSVVAILPPFIVLLVLEYLSVQDSKKQIVEKICLVSAGWIVPLLLFFAYLVRHSAWNDFFHQNQIIVQAIGGGDRIETYLNFIASILQWTPGGASDFRGKIFTGILVICLFVLLREGIQKFRGQPMKSCPVHTGVLAVCLVTIFGYLNSVHVYETFRLVNGASLGIGICVLLIADLYRYGNKPIQWILAAAGVWSVLWLSATLFFHQTTSSYYPWKKEILLGEGIRNDRIGILKGKLLSRSYNDFYQEVFETIEPYKCCCCIINYTWDVVAFAMNDLPRIQISPVNIPGVNDLTRQSEWIARGKAVVLSNTKPDFPGYVIVFAKQWPQEIPWLGGGYLFISVPQQYLKKALLRSGVS